MSKWFSCAKNLTEEGESYVWGAEFGNLKTEILAPPVMIEKERLSYSDIQCNFLPGEISSSLHDQK